MSFLSNVKKGLIVALVFSLALTFTLNAQSKTPIKFYGKIVEYASGVPMVEALQAQFKDQYDIEGIQVDWGNLDKIIRIGIASGEPADVYQYWPQSISRFVADNMALDLTPYLEANGGAWKKTFIPSALETGKVNGKYYALPLNSNFSLMIANKALLDKAGVKVPDAWTWAEFLAACKKIQTLAKVFPLANATDNGRADWIFRNGMLSTFKSANKLDDLVANKIPASDPLWASVLSNVKGLYDSAYMYPGQGAVMIKNDEVKAGFYQGKVAIMTEIAAGASATIKDAGFETIILPWPSMGKTNAVLGGCDGVFIPANAPHKEDAIKILKAYLGTDIQKIHAKAGLPIVNNAVQIDDPLTKRIVQVSDNVEIREFGLTLSKVSEYTGKVLLGDLVLDPKKGVKGVQDKMESFRKEMLAAKK